MLLVEYTILDKLQVINETVEGGQQKLKLRGRFQKCDEQNNNGRIYPRKILESQVQKIQEKINDRSLVGALDHPANDAIHLSQASHLITGLSVDKSGDVIGECEILSTPNGQIVKNLINDGVKIGISSRGVGSVSEGREGKVVNEDFKLITFDLVSDPSTKGAFPELTESIRENSQRAQEIVSKHKKDRVLLTMLESKINEATKKLSRRQRQKIDRTPPFGKITASDLAAVRSNESEENEKILNAAARKAAAQSRPKKKKKKEEMHPLLRVLRGGAQKDYDNPNRPRNTRQGQRMPRNPKVDDAVELFGDIIRERCWAGYEPTPGVKAYAKGSCKPTGSKKNKKKGRKK